MSKLTEAQQAEKARMTELFDAQALRTNAILLAREWFPKRARNSEYLPLIDTLVSIDRALVRYEVNNEEAVVPLFASLVEVFKQVEARLAELHAQRELVNNPKPAAK